MDLSMPPFLCNSCLDPAAICSHKRAESKKKKKKDQSHCFSTNLKEGICLFYKLAVVVCEKAQQQLFLLLLRTEIRDKAATRNCRGEGGTEGLYVCNVYGEG